MAGQFLAAWWPQTLGKRISAELPATGNFPDFFPTCFDIWTWNLVYTSGRWHDTSSLSFITIRRVLQTFSLSVLRLESWLIHSVGCTTYWVHVSPDWGPYDLLHVLSLGTGNWQGIHWCWQTGILGSLWLLLFKIASRSPWPMSETWGFLLMQSLMIYMFHFLSFSSLFAIPCWLFLRKQQNILWELH